MSPSPYAIELAALANPFSDSAVGSVWEPAMADVPEIHSAVFDSLLRIVDERAEGKRHRCTLLYGDAGSGKTHLLRRLRLALEERNGRFIPFSWARMYTAPAMMWRYLRRHLADDLTRRQAQGRTQLAHLLSTRRHKIEAIEHRDLSIVLEHLSEGRFRRDARAWLAGASLPEDAYQAMGVNKPDADEEAVFEDQSRQVVLGLIDFAAPAPIAVCLDQLEHLQRFPGDRDGLFAIGKLLSTLHDEAPNAVVIGSIQTGLIGDLEKTISKAEQDRYLLTALRPLTSTEAQALVLKRLSTEPRIHSLRPPGHSPFWPIELSRLDPLLASPEGLSARKLIFACEQMFRRAQKRPDDSIPLEELLKKKIEERKRKSAEELTADTSTGVLSDGLPRLLHLEGYWEDRAGLPAGIDHVVRREGAKPIAVVIANDHNWTLWRKLERVLDGWRPGEQKLVILRDAHHPLKATPGAQERLRKLEHWGARIVTPSREALLALDAARRLLADADSGELTHHGDKVAPSSVEDWIRGSLPDPLKRLMAEVTGSQEEATPPAELNLALAAILSERKMASVAELAAALERTSQEVETCARANPDQFGYLGGMAAVVFERIPASAGA